MEGVTIINYLCSSPQLYWGLLAFLPYCFSIDSELKDGNFTISQGKKGQCCVYGLFPLSLNGQKKKTQTINTDLSIITS